MIKLNESKSNNVPINDNHQLWCELLGTWITPKQYKEIEVKWNHIFKDSIKINDYSKVEKKYGIYLDWIRESIGASKSKKTNESTQVSDVNTGRPADTSITVKKKKNEMNESLSLNDIKDAKSGTYISVGGKSYSKVKKGLWQQDTTSAHGIGATYSDSQMYNLIKDKDAKLNESADISKLIRSGDKDKLTKYLASLGDGEVITDPKDKNTTYHKASNGVKSGWGEHHNGKRTSVTLYKDDQLAKFLLNESVMNESIEITSSDKKNLKKLFDSIKKFKFVPGKDEDASVGNFSASLFWHKPSINVSWYPILQIDYKDDEIFNREGSENSNYYADIIKEATKVLSKKYKINESVDMTQVSTLEGQGCDREAVAVPCAYEEPVAESIPKKDDSQKFTDIKYMTILNILKANGYEGTRFFGSEGYLIPDKYPNTMVRLVCRTISEGFKINVLGGLYDMATSKDCAKQLRECNSLANKLNQILIDDTDINEMIDAQILTPNEERLID